MRRVALNANGVRHELELEPRELLVYVLRERLGLTGTNVGCDTSSCGSCTVLVNGESVKSCTMLGVQADGTEITTIEGLATNGELHPVQQAFHDHHALQCGYCTPGMVHGRREPHRERRRDRRGGDPRRARGEPLPLHRVPQHRPGRRGRRGGERHDRHRDGHTFVGTSVKRKEDASLLRGRGTYVDNLTLPGTVFMAVVRSPYPHARIKSVNLDAARAAEGVVAAFSGADLADDWKGCCRAPGRSPRTSRCRRTTRSPSTRRAIQGDGVAVVIAESRAPREGRGRARRGRLRAAPVDRRRREGARRTARRSCTTTSARTSATSGSSTRTTSRRRSTLRDVVVTRRYFQPRLIPNAIEPRGVLAQVGPTGDVTLWSATQIPHILRFALQLVLGIPESKIRVIAPDVGGGFGSKLDVYAEEALAVALARRLGRPVKWTEERSENYSGDDSRARRRARADVRGDQGRRRSRPSSPMRSARWARTSSSSRPASRCSGPGSTRARTRSRTTASRSPASSRTRPRPTRTAAPAGPRRRTCIERTMDALARELGMDPLELRRKNFIKEFPHRWPRGSRSTRATTTRRSTGCSRCSTSDAIRADQAGASDARRREADRRRLLDLQRDVRPRAVAHPRCDPLRGRRLGLGHDPLPAARLGAGRDRDVAARPEPRDDVAQIVADQLGVDRRRRRGAARRHRRLAARDGHVRQPLAGRRRHRSLAREPEDHRQGPPRSSPINSRWRRTTSSSTDGTFA